MRTIAVLILLSALGGCAALPTFGSLGASAPIEVTYVTPVPRSREAALDDFWRERRVEAMYRNNARPPAAFAAQRDPVVAPDYPSDGWLSISERMMQVGRKRK